MKLNHLHFRSPKLPETRRFYEDYFGFSSRVELNRTVVLANEESFFLAIDPDSSATASAESSLHFGFCLNSEESVRVLFDRMKAAGVPFTQELKQLSPNALQFYCQDPTGNCVEVGWYRPLM